MTEEPNVVELCKKLWHAGINDMSVRITGWKLSELAIDALCDDMGSNTCNHSFNMRVLTLYNLPVEIVEDDGVVVELQKTENVLRYAPGVADFKARANDKR